ncbi:E3 ubiquitin-protein ligase rnf213-alpha-like isoform X2 [Carcharodon carcharias]|uniref:E3 ubiquitin-protein ligase rnf213-alpha-like isoform X2 n=1 Tax=Carcharodon carcharias TaxID=13397 RepID=UPI001B7E3691|nr:E3 ubiquitin-protein ligase rnf213-alpha-like isoform X2 [Carcharodon carcharias]
MEDSIVQPAVAQQFQETSGPDSSTSLTDHIPVQVPATLESASAAIETVDSDIIDASETLSEPIITSETTTNRLLANGETASLSFSENAIQGSTCLPESTEKSTEFQQETLPSEVNKKQIAKPQEFQETFPPNAATSGDQCFPHRDPVSLEPTSETIETLDLGDTDVFDKPNGPTSNSLRIIGDASTSRETLSPSLSQNATKERTDLQEPAGNSTEESQKWNRKKNGNDQPSVFLEKSGNLPCLPEKESSADSTRAEVANQQHKLNVAAAVKGGVMNIPGLLVEKDLPDTHNECSPSSDKHTSQSVLGGVDRLGDKTKAELTDDDYFTVMTDDEKDSPLQTDVVSNTECMGSKRKKRKKCRNRNRKKRKDSTHQTTATNQKKESPANDSAETTLGEQADGERDHDTSQLGHSGEDTSETAQVPAEPKLATEQKQSEPIKDMKQVGPQDAVKEQIPPSESTPGDGEHVESKSKKKRKKRQNEKKDSQQKSKMLQVADEAEGVSTSAASDNVLELEAPTIPQTSNVDSKKAREGGKVKTQSELEAKERAAGASQSGQSKSEDTTKQISTKDQSASYNADRCDSVQENRRAMQKKGGSETNDDNKNVPEANPTDKSKKPSNDQNQPAACFNLPVSHTFTIHINAIIPNEVNFNRRQDKLFLLFENAAILLEVINLRKLNKNGCLIQSNLIQHPDIKGKTFSYCYAVEKKNEWIEEVVVRFLTIPYTLIENEWHQYDGIMSFPQSWDIMHAVKSITQFRMSSEEKILQSKHLGGRFMLETIFSLLGSLNIERFEQVKKQLKHFQLCSKMTFNYERYSGAQQVRLGEEQVKELITEQLKTFLQPYTQSESQKAKKSEKTVKNRFVAGMVAFAIQNHCSLKLDTSNLVTICQMLQLPQERTEEVLQDLEEFATFFQSPQYTCKGLINCCIQHGVLELVLVVPLLHWCMEQHQPERSVSSEASSTRSEPLNGVSYGMFCYRIRNHPEKRRKLLELMFQMKPLVKMDPTLVFTWFSLVPSEDIPEYAKEMGVSLNHVVQELMCRLKGLKEKMENANFKLLDKDIQVFAKSICYIKDTVAQQSERVNISELLENDVKWSTKMLTIICELTNRTGLYEVPALSFQLVMKVAEKVKMLLTESQDEPSPEENQDHVNVKLVIDGAQDCLRSWRTRTLLKDLLSKAEITDKKELEMWNCHFTMECGVTDWATEWSEATRIDLIKRIQKENPSDQIVIYWNEKETLTTLNPILLDCFEHCALNAVEEVCQSKKEAKLLEKLNPWKHQKCAKVLSELIEESGKRMGSSNFGSVLSSDCAVHYCLLQGDCSKLDVSEKARGLLKDAENSFHMVVECLYQGSVKVADLQLLLDKRNEYSNLFQAQQKLPEHQKKRFFQVDAGKLVSKRGEELEAFLSEKKSIGTLINMINKAHETITVTDITYLEEKYKTNIQSMRLEELIKTKPWRDEESKIQPACCVKYFNLGSAVTNMALTMHKLRDSSVLLNCWLQAAKEFSYEDYTLDDLCTSIWHCCWTDYTELFHKTDQGTITFQEVDRMFFDLRGQPGEIRKELSNMFQVVKGKELPLTRLDQIKQYFELHLAVDSARVIQDIVKELKLQGDFRRIQNLTKINEHSFKKHSLDYVDKGLIQTKTLLAKMTPECVKCLEEFVQKQPFVNWVKGALTNLREVKVFVDLASISAGENDMEIDRVACFHDAVMGYSSFIYELPQSTDFEGLKTSVEKIQKALNSDPKLMEKLRDSARYLEWLKTLRESHGSVETSSLSLAAAINHKGVYRVGNIGQLHEEKLSLENVLQLSLYDESTKERKKYTLTELRELQNKLMLMSGKRECGKEEVARFMEDFNSVQRLGKAFIELYSSGNMLYRNWKAHVFCSKESDVCIIMDFNVRGIGSLKVGGDLSEQLQVLCRALEECLRGWCEFIEKSREKFYYLNYYTAEQIVYLCSELGRFAAGKPLCKQVMTMLSFIKTDCTVKDVRSAMLQLITLPEISVNEETDGFELKPGESESESEDEETDVFELKAGESESESEEIDVDLIEFDLPNTSSFENSTERVYAQKPTQSHYEEHDNEVTKRKAVEPAELQYSEFAPFQQIEPAESVCEEMHDAGVLKISPQMENASLSEEIALLWNKFMKNMAAFLIDHLDILVFGMLLSHLSGMNESKVRRQLPPSLYHGRPNLIVCAQPEIFRAALCVYMQNQRQPLPTYDEVLLCSEETTYEEVEVFLRRALSRGSHEQKIYTLIHADCLSYETSVRFGELFEELMRHCNPVYQFVVICDAKRRHCYIPSYLSHYKIPAGLSVKTEAVQQYLVYHFTVPASQLSAAQLFHDRLSVRIISSKRPGVGKSLYIDRLHEKLLQHYPRIDNALKRIRLIEPVIDENRIVQMLHDLSSTCDFRRPVIFHIDAAPVRKRLEEFLFKILILGFLKNSQGRIWKRSTADLYIVEHLDANEFLYKPHTQQVNVGLLGILPTIYCRTPREVRQLELKKREDTVLNILDPLMDEEEFVNEAIQRPYQYLRRFSVKINIDQFMYRKHSVEGNPAECLTLLLQYCGLRDPSWAELRNFSWFLNLQLKNCEQSMFCNPSFVGDTLIGFKNFIVEFMILMAQDFATPSMNISDESPAFSTPQADEDLLPYIIRKRWETHPHPYIFFNADTFSMTFLGFHLRRNNRRGFDAVDQHTGEVLRGNIMSSQLESGLGLQRIRFNENIDALPREEKIQKLSRVLGVEKATDPDKTYELTADNMMKMLAIHMRFRCEIPVIIMGETGCGKTRLIKFLCDLQKGKHNTETMKLVKVHGGTTAATIYAKIREAEKLAIENKHRYGLETVLFFDEANTTEAIHAIKEVLCDKTVQGKAMKCDTGLKIIAACNPYRKHSEDMIQRLEMAGLGYRVKAEETEDKLGKVPLRQLVYRVQPLPSSMIPLVWDFGQLSDKAELAYTSQIVQRYIHSHSLPFLHTETIIMVLAASQQFMRQRKNECSFVSLRDVERSMKVLVWFYCHRFFLFDYPNPNTNILQALISAVGVCYYPSLLCKEAYLKNICRFFPEPYDSPDEIQAQIVHCHDIFMKNIKTRETIAKNEALKENVFLMVICIELRIPLFLVGKPGSSKSLAKTVVLDAMQGQSSHCDLFKKLKQVHMVSFQCSPHSTPEGIITTFKQCARFQQGRNLDEYVSVVVLDEIGLAEDSPQMPLKTLHPLLEDGCVDDDNPLPHKKVGFIGISNWALDPAKMNRGIFVSRLDPCEKELIDTAEGICSSDLVLLQKVQHLFPIFAQAYLEVCGNQNGQFFGLRDYYSLVKMVFITAKETKCEPTEEQLADTILRNFSGKDEFNPLEIFLPTLNSLPQTSTLEMVKKNIKADSSDGECRYLLLLTKNFVALQIVLQHVFQDLDDKPEIIFGSSFPKDQEYTQICRNVNRVKICMETGRTVILLNLKNLYESLYDALNQYYVNLGEYQYVDLGLGTHRVKCRVDRKFRLIVVEDKDVVYKQFPIPLINRLEKHSLDMSTVLNLQQQSITKQLELWVKEFVSVKMSRDGAQGGLMLNPSEVIIGFHADACASVVLQVLDTANLKSEGTFEDTRTILKSAKHLLLNCVTPDAVVRLKHSKLGGHEVKQQWEEYFVQQRHRSLSDYIHQHLGNAETRRHNCVEVTTFSRLLTKSDIKVMAKELGNNVGEFLLLFLHQFDTEHSFCKKIRESFQNSNTEVRVLLIQMDTEESSLSSELIASAKYCTMNEMNLMNSTAKSNCYVYFITKLSRIAGGSKYIGFQGGQWLSVHIDDVTESEEMASDISAFYNTTISELFAKAMGVQGEINGPNTVPEDDQQAKKLMSRPSILNTTFLLQSCIQSAISIICDGKDGSSRNTERVQILLNLLREEGKCEAQFLRTVKERLMLQLQEQEEMSPNPKEWMCNEAKKIGALQEGGTFRHTLWKCIQKTVTPKLAQMISILDRDYNLNLLVDPKVNIEIKALWLDIFSDLQILRVSHQAGSSGPKAEEITVDHKVSKGHAESPCATPFSWLIKEYIDQLWLEFQYLEGSADRGMAKMLKFVDSFNKSKLGEYLGRQSKESKCDLGQRYLTDFILMTINGSSFTEVQVFRAAFISCMNELQNDCGLTLQEQSPPWIHIAYNIFKSRLHNLSKTIALYPTVQEHIYNYLQGTMDSNPQEMMLDIFAAYACAERVQALDIVTIKDCKELIEIMETVQPSVKLIYDKNYIKACRPICQQTIAEIRSNWERALVLGVFIEHVVFSVADTDAKLRDIAVKHCAQLQKILRTSADLKKNRTVEAVIEVLQMCNEEASHLDYRYGIKECPICLGELKDPACLPCKHVFCINCLESSFEVQSLCPKCKATVPGSFKIEVSIQLKKALEKHNNFRQKCNMFFMEVVSRFCFSEDSPPSDGVIILLLSLLIAVRESPKGNLYQTRTLTPFSECVDINPVIRSVLLKLMLHYSFDKVKVFMQKYLSSLEEKIFFKEDLKELHLLFINCFEDSICGHFEQSGGFGSLELLKQNCSFASRFARHQVATCEENATEYLQNIARLRFCFTLTAKLMYESHNSTDVKHKAIKANFIEHIKMICLNSDNDWYRVYLMRTVYDQYGMDFVQNLQQLKDNHWMFPDKIIEKQCCWAGGQMDRFIFYGLQYKTIRDAVAEAALTCQVSIMTNKLKALKCPLSNQQVYMALAFFHEVTCSFAAEDDSLHATSKSIDTLQRFIKGNRLFEAPALKDFCTTLVKNELGSLEFSLRITPTQSNQRRILIEIIVHAALVFICGKNVLSSPLRNIAFDSAKMRHAYLPTMPEDLRSEAKGWISEKVTWYECQCGEVIPVGQCGRPVQVARCPTCFGPIGGQNHTPVPGFTLSASSGDQTQSGHILGPASRRNKVVAPDRQMTPVAFLLLRALTHVSMMLGAVHHHQIIGEMIKSRVPNVSEFLWQHLEADLNQLGKSLGKNIDDTATCIHLVIDGLLNKPQGNEHREVWDEGLSSKKSRNAWESHFIKALISPLLKVLDERLSEVGEQMSSDDRIGGSPVVKMLYGDPSDLLSFPRDVLDCTSAWKCQPRICVENFTHIVEQKGGKKLTPILWKFLQKACYITLLKDLPNLLELQYELIRTFQSASDVKSKTISQFLQQMASDQQGQRHSFEKRIKIFLQLWNQLRLNLAENDLKIPKELCQKDLTLESPIEILLPQPQGPGLCATALSKFLIEIQNNLIGAINDHKKSSISPEEISDVHVIICDPDKDFIPLILSNCQYSLEKGQETIREYDIKNIERQLIRLFLKEKPFIVDYKIPKFVGRHERDYSSIFMKLKAKITQEILSHSVCTAVTTVLKSYSDICDALDIIEIVVGFLATAGGAPDHQLLCYLKDTLLMGRQALACVSKAFEGCKLKHTLSLWQLLSSWKSEVMLGTDKDPFERIPDAYKEKLHPQEERELKSFFASTDINTFLWELHEILVLKTAQSNVDNYFPSTWSLKDTLSIYLESKGSDILPGLEDSLSDEIALAKSIQTWKLAVNFKKGIR